MRVVLDTNIFVSMLLGGRLGTLNDDWKAEKFVLVVSHAIGIDRHNRTTSLLGTMGRQGYQAILVVNRRGTRVARKGDDQNVVLLEIAQRIAFAVGARQILPVGRRVTDGSSGIVFASSPKRVRDQRECHEHDENEEASVH